MILCLITTSDIVRFALIARLRTVHLYVLRGFVALNRVRVEAARDRGTSGDGIVSPVAMTKKMYSAESKFRNALSFLEVEYRYTIMFISILSASWL